MQNWQLTPQDPFSLILAADYRTSHNNSEEDNVWELQYDSGEFGGISLYTTLSLRTLSLRIFPVFSNALENRIRISQFNNPPIIHKFFPNYVLIKVSPFEGITANIEYWVQSTTTVVSRMVTNNTSSSQFEGKVSWAMILNPLSGGEISRHVEWGKNHVLAGSSDNLHIGLLLNGAPQPVFLPFPALELPLSLYPGALQEHKWVMSTAPSRQETFFTCDQWVREDIQKSLARLEVLQQRDCFLIESGDPDWDAAFAFSQNSALQIVMPSDQLDESNKIISARQPENNNNWLDIGTSKIPESPFSPKELWYLRQCLPGNPGLARSILGNFLENQENDGFIPTQLHPGKTALPLLAYPMLCTLASDVLSGNSESWEFNELFNKLFLYLKQWFLPGQDKDQDGYPEWTHAVHSLRSNLPIHDQWHLSGTGIETKWIESPMLAALLINEINSLLTMAPVLGIVGEPLTWLINKKDNLTEALQSTWEKRKNYYQYRDSISHQNVPGKKVITVKKTGVHHLQKKIDPPQRINLKFLSQKESTQHIRIFIHGNTSEGETVEEISSRQIHWSELTGFATSNQLFSSLISIEVEMMPPGNQVTLYTADFSSCDITSFLPIWAGFADKTKTKKMTEKWLEKEFLQPFGLPLVPISRQPKGEVYNQVDIIINTMIISGLLDQGFQHSAQFIFENLMRGIVKNLKMFHRFHELYDASDGYGIGDYNIINGLAPVKLFLKLCGIENWSSSEIQFGKKSIFNQQIRIQYQGTNVICTPKGNILILPGGNRIEVEEQSSFKLRQN